MIATLSYYYHTASEADTVSSGALNSTPTNHYHAAFNAPCVGHKDDESQAPALVLFSAGALPRTPPGELDSPPGP